ncbi:cell adhesion molecule 3-like [Aulostomus maculatus]
MEIIGGLNQRNCSTLFSSLTPQYSDTYFFRMENPAFRANARCEPVQIKVTDSPARPMLDFPGKLRETELVTLTCSASTPCPHKPPKLNWNLHPDAPNKKVGNADGTFRTEIQKNITLSHKHDGENITCSAEYPVNGGSRAAETTRTLHVSYAPKNTSASASPAGLVSPGSLVNLSCSSRAKPPVSSFTWFKKSRGGAVNVSEGDFYRLNVTEGGVYYCVATNNLGDQSSPEIQLIVAGEQTDGSVQWGIVGGITGVVVLIGLVVCVWHSKSKHSAAANIQSRAEDEDVVPAETHKEKEEIHYGEIDFSNRKAEASCSVQHSGQQQDTVYSQVQVYKSTNTTTAGTEDVYAQVK